MGHRIIVHTDHKNLICKNFNTDRVMRWRLIIEEFRPELHYIKGEDNIVADALSRMDMLSTEEYEELYTGEEQIAECYAADVEEFPQNYPLTY